MRRLVTLAALAVLLPTHAAMAQSPTTASKSSGLVGLNLASNSIAVVNSSEDAQAGAAGAARKYIPRIFGGLWLGAGQGFLAGAGVSMRPFTDRKHEIQGNGAFLRVESSNGFAVDVDYFFNFNDNVGEFSPYAGGGLIFAHQDFGCGDVEDFLGIDIDCNSTDAGLQVGGGLKKPLASGKEFFVEAFAAFLSGGPFIIRGGLGW